MSLVWKRPMGVISYSLCNVILYNTIITVVIFLTLHFFSKWPNIGTVVCSLTSHFMAFHYTWQVVLPEKFCAKQMVLKNVIRTYWGMQKSKMQNHIMCPLRGLVQHRPKNPPNLGRMGCLYQLLSPKGHMILFCTLLFWIPQLVLITFFNTICFAQNFSGEHLRRYSE